MVELPTELPNDLEQLKKLLGVIASERDDFFRRLQLLEHRYKEEMRAKYGRRSETIDPDQLRLFMQEALKEPGESSQARDLNRSPEAVESEQPPVAQKKQGHGRRKPQSLPKRTSQKTQSGPLPLDARIGCLPAARPGPNNCRSLQSHRDLQKTRC